jgi:hypothetical protein
MEAGQEGSTVFKDSNAKVLLLKEEDTEKGRIYFLLK